MTSASTEEIIKLVIDYLDRQGKPPSKIAVQKIMFFLNERGINMPYEFEVFAYGPYSRELSFTIQDLQLSGEIEIDETRYKKGEAFSLNDITEEDKEKLNNLLNEFNELVEGDYSFNNLERYGTVLYCYRALQNFQMDDSVEAVIKEVKGWKGKKFSDPRIQEAYQKIASKF